jgi:DNA-binding NarL/FixJ family response regulator
MSSGIELRSSPATVRVLVADGHGLFSGGLRELFTDHGIDLVGEAATADAAVSLAVKHMPDIVIVDLDLPDASGIDVIRALAVRVPHARPVVVTSADQDDRVADAILAGACGYVLKDAPLEELLGCVRAVEADCFPVSPRIAAKLVTWFRESESGRRGDEHLELTPREREVLKLIADGRDNTEIAKILFLSRRTVRNHVSNIFRKLHTENRVQAAVYAVRRGLI